MDLEPKVRLPSLEEKVDIALSALFDECGMEIALRVLIDWSVDKWYKGRRTKDGTPWYMELVFDQLRAAQKLYENRYKILESED
jgi:hypothetical protein